MGTEPCILTPADLLTYWLGHRRLTRRVIQAFPDTALFTFMPAPPMRSFAELIWEIHETTTYTLNVLLTGICPPTSRGEVTWPDRAALLADWDALSARLDTDLPGVPPERYTQTLLFPWQVETGFQAALGEIDNEIHHRGQGTVYLRLLGVKPPEFWER